jgi:hypothetical protein
MLTKEQLRAVIKEARADVAAGWCQKTFTNREDVCIMGGVLNALRSQKLMDNDFWSAYHDVLGFLDLIANQMGYGDAYVVRTIAFNDHPDTTQQDALNFLDKALAELGDL